jgi:heme-degrading monooxygenase HmoA
MYARLMEMHISSGKIDECIGILRDRNGPAIGVQPGFDHGHWFVDRDTARVASVTFWKTESDELASRSTIPDLIQKMAHVLASVEVRQESFEVVHEQRAWEEPYHG